MEMPFSIDPVLTKDEMKTILNFMKSVDEFYWFQENGFNVFDVHTGKHTHSGMGANPYFWHGRTIHLPKIKELNNEVPLLIKKWAHGVRKKAMKHYNLRYLLPDGPHLVRWLTGYELYPHCDQEEPDPNFPPHPYPHRDFGSITWLNDEYEGGQIYYPNIDNFKPEMGVGVTVFHRGTCVPHMHGVENITSGVRYTIAGFWTAQENPPPEIIEIAKMWDMSPNDKIGFEKTKPIPFNRR